MSDPVTNVEIEDVLSSIRRLFKEDKRSTDAVASSPVEHGENEPEAPVQQGGRLVLTEALRVDDVALNDAVEAVDPEPESSLTERLTRAESEANSQIGGAAEPAKTLHLVPQPELAPEEPAQDPAQESARAVSEAVGDWTRDADDESADGGSDTAAESEGPVTSGPENMQADASNVDAGVLILGAALAANAEHDSPQGADTPSAEVAGADKTATSEADQHHGEASEPALDNPVISASLERQSTLASTIAELEAAISDQENEFEPDGSEEIGSIPENEPLQWQDSETPPLVLKEVPNEPSVIELDAVGPQNVDPEYVRRHAAQDEDLVAAEEVAPTAETPDHSPEFFSRAREATLSDDDNLALQEALERDVLSAAELPIDEDELRDLVAEIVRQELQGALGERITRNVRKLVRREIHRIISSQEFD
jgi:hypothetical protein